MSGSCVTGNGGGAGGGTGGGSGGGTGSETPLLNGVSVSVSGATNSLTQYTITVTGPSSQLTIMLTPTAGDPDLYLRAGAPPDLSTGTFDMFSDATGVETLTVPSPSSGIYFLTVSGYSAYTGTLTATW